MPGKRKNMHKMLTGWTFCKCMRTKFLATPAKSDVRYMQEDTSGDDDDDDEYVFALLAGIMEER